MDHLAELEHRVAALEQRNARVEADKAWEMSTARRLLTLVSTYIIIAAYLAAVVRIEPWVNAVVPAVAFTLSTASVPRAKRLWLNRHPR